MPKTKPPGFEIGQFDSASKAKKVSLSWLEEAGIDVEAIRKEWKDSANKNDVARLEIIKRALVEQGATTKLTFYAAKLLTEGIK